MYCAWRIPAHLRCTQCSILLHLMDICFLTCICLWQISHIQTRLFSVVGPGLVSTSPAFVSSSGSAWPACPKNGKSGPHCWGREGSTQFAQQFLSAVTAPPLVGYVVWSFPIGLDFLFIIFFLHLFLSWGIFLSFSSSAISASTLSNNVFLGLPTGLLPSTPNSIHFHTQPTSPFLIICPYHPRLPPLITVMIGSDQFSQLFTCPSVFHLIICISALSNFNPPSTSKGLVSLPKIMLLLTQLTYTRLQRGSSGCQKWKTPSELHPPISDSSCSNKIRSTISIKSVSHIKVQCMIIQKVCLSINKFCNDASHFVFLFYIYYFQVVFHETQFRHTFELNYAYINIFFLSVKHSKFADLYYQSFLCKHWNVLY